MQYRNESYAEGVFDTFWFEKNLQGDVVAIYNNSGVKLASYIYDAWGNFTVTYTNGCLLYTSYTIYMMNLKIYPSCGIVMMKEKP